MSELIIRKMKKSGGQSNLIRNSALILVLVLSLNLHICNSYDFNEVSPLFHLKTDYVVSHESHYYDVDYVQINVCEAFNSTARDEQLSGYATRSYEVLHQQCNTTFYNDVITELNFLAEWKAKPNLKGSSAFQRVKRWIFELLTFFVVMLVVSAVAYTINEVFNPDSDHNKLQALKERETQRQIEINNINGALNKSGALASTQNDMLNHLKESSERMETKKVSTKFLAWFPSCHGTVPFYTQDCSTLV